MSDISMKSRSERRVGASPPPREVIMQGELRPHVDNSRAQDGVRARCFRCTAQPKYFVAVVDFAGDISSSPSAKAVRG